MQTIYRPNLKAWLRRNPIVFGLPVLVFGLLIIDRFSVPALIMTGLACSITFIGMRRAVSNFIVLDNRQIGGSFRGQPFKVQWWDVRAAWLDTHSDGNPVLMLATDQNLFAIPLRYMDASAIWAKTQSSVNPAALKDEARQDLPYWQPVAGPDIPELDEPLVLRGRALEKVIAWGALFFPVLVLSAGFDQLGLGLQLMLVGFILVFSGFLLTTYYSLKISPTGITHSMLFGKFFISWDELKSVHIAQDGSTLMFQSGRKQILVYGPKTWSKSMRDDAMQYIGVQLEVRQIHVRVDPWLGLRMAFSSRAARVRRSSEM